MYLNSIYYGPYAYGLASAANVYFHKPVAQLTLPESASSPACRRPPPSTIPSTTCRGSRLASASSSPRWSTAGYLTSAQADSVRTARTTLDP